MSIGVLHLIKGLGSGGAEQLVLDTSRSLDRGRFRTGVSYLLPSRNALLPAFTDHGIPVSCLGHGPMWPLRLRQTIAAFRPDVVHMHSPYPAAIARSVLGASKPSIVYTEHNMWGRYRTVTHWANRLTYGVNDHVFAVSEKVRESITAVRGSRPPHIEVLHHGIDLISPPIPTPDLRIELGIEPGAFTIGTVANLKQHKGHLVFLRALVEIRKVAPHVRWVVVGSGPMRRVIEDETRALGLERNVIMTGHRLGARALLQSFDIFVLPSLYEGLPMALLEAMAAGRAIVATDVGGSAEVIRHDREGLLVTGGNPRALAGAVISLINDPDKRTEMGRSARERSREFDIRRAVGRLEEVYEQLALG